MYKFKAVATLKYGKDVPWLCKHHIDSVLHNGGMKHKCFGNNIVRTEESYELIKIPPNGFNLMKMMKDIEHSVSLGIYKYNLDCVHDYANQIKKEVRLSDVNIKFNVTIFRSNKNDE